MMVLERSEVTIKPGMEDAFLAAMQERGLALLAGLPGCKSAKLGRGIENPDKFILLLEWESVEAHKAAIPDPNFAAFREIIMPVSAGGAMEHFAMV
jgi:heme-degrading monooxygenase HmoA